MNYEESAQKSPPVKHIDTIRQLFCILFYHAQNVGSFICYLNWGYSTILLFLFEIILLGNLSKESF